MADRWTDGRTGKKGCFLANLALNKIDPSGKSIVNVKGTTFEDGENVYVGRVVADDYLGEGSLHWANASWAQHNGLIGFATGKKKRLVYLFISWLPRESALRYWIVPATIVEQAMVGREKNNQGEVLSLVIRDVGGHHMIGESDVTAMSTKIELSERQIEQLNGFDGPDAAGGTAKGADVPPTRGPDKPQREAGSRTFVLHISDHRQATLELPGPLSQGDIDRIKGWIDLNADLLT